VPEAVASYQREEALSDNLEDYQIELDGYVYSMPVPVSILAEDGWTLDENESDSVIKAGYYGWVTLRKGGQEIHEIAVNPERYATNPSNCWIEGLEIGSYTLTAEGALPGGISEGMSEDEFLNILDEAGMEYEVEESGDYKYYTYNKLQYDQCMEVTVYAGDDGSYEQNTIIKISCSNPVE
jgi:hypothetical protein